ncbi:MAG: hypothetical protein PF689_02485 [Deltaproteobacteria bacterium]|jgi:hypothetical protein|nr:hypothetical protein [Deltaproteobacteria bacterium]
MKHSIFFSKLLVFFTAIICLAAACKKTEKEQNKKHPLAPKVDASLKTPTNYCEKTFYCSLKKLISDEARKVMNYKRKEFLKNCKLALSKLPDKMTKEFNSCLQQKCGFEFRKCIMKISDKYIIPPEKEKNTTSQNRQKNKSKNKASSILETKNKKSKEINLKHQAEKDKEKTNINETKKTK